jgi:hypothetical protein
MVDIVWKERTGQFATGFGAYVGSIAVGTTSRSFDRVKGWQATCILPGVAIKPDFALQVTEADARKIVELAVRRWLKLAGLE